MNIESLKLFVDVMHKRSFTEIARAQGVAASSVSRSITSLEKELGFKLFQRTTRKVTPTEAGIKYFERIDSILDDLEAAQQIATDLNNRPVGTLRITAPVVFGQMYIVPLLPILANQYPELSIELDLNDAYVDLLEERIDVAIRVGSLSDSSYIARKLSDMRFYVCATQVYFDQQIKPEKPQDLQKHNCLLMPRTGYNFNWLFKQKNKTIIEVSINGKYLVNNSKAIRECMLAGMGVALLPDWLVANDILTGKVVNLFEDYEVTPTNYDGSVWLVYPSREYLPLKVRVFNEFLIENLNRKSNDVI